MIESIFPSTVRVAQGDPQQMEGELYPQEESFVTKSVMKRRREFTAGRLLARSLLNEFGLTDFPLLMGKHREPLWPEVLCGSITHTQNYCAVVVARKHDVTSLGLDAVLPQDVRENIWPAFCSPKELAGLEALPPQSRQQQAALIFSAKESLYKCLFPVLECWIDFKDVEIQVGSSGYFNAEFAIDKKGFKKGTRVRGQYYFQPPYLLTGITWTGL